jgi:hypothetical protein
MKLRVPTTPRRRPKYPSDDIRLALYVSPADRKVADQIRAYDRITSYSALFRQLIMARAREIESLQNR